MTRMRRAALAAAVLTAAPLFGAIELPPDNWEARETVRDTVLGPVSALSFVRPRVLAGGGETGRVQFRVEKREGHVFLLFLNERDGYPLASSGNVSIKRGAVDGGFEYMTVLLRNHPACYLRLYPSGESSGRSRLDVVLFGVAVYRDLMIAAEFDALLTAPLRRIVDLSRGKIDWDLVLGKGEESRKLALMVRAIRRSLPELLDEEDGAFNADGRPVLIATGAPSAGGLNCSGFAKWIVDGLYHPLAGKYMDIDRLKARQQQSRGNRWTARLEDQRDPFFGLDLQPGEERAVRGRLYLIQGTPAEAVNRFRTDFPTGK